MHPGKHRAFFNGHYQFFGTLDCTGVVKWVTATTSDLVRLQMYPVTVNLSHESREERDNCERLLRRGVG